MRETGRTDDAALVARENHLRGSDGANYRRFEFDLIAPHCGRRVLEVGAGFGDFADQFRDLDRLVLSDVDPECLDAMRTRFAHRDEVDVVPLDLSREVALDEPVDTVVSLNVFEHLVDDVGVLRRLAGLVEPGGTIVTWVPGYRALYGEFDRSVGHIRRYSPESAGALVTGAGLVVDHIRPVNFLGGIAWWLAVRAGRQCSLSPALVRPYDRFVIPLTRAVERRFQIPFGQSILCVARVPEAPRIASPRPPRE